jgi:hypothetical protein
MPRGRHGKADSIDACAYAASRGIDVVQLTDSMPLNSGFVVRLNATYRLGEAAGLRISCRQPAGKGVECWLELEQKTERGR